MMRSSLRSRAISVCITLALFALVIVVLLPCVPVAIAPVVDSSPRGLSSEAGVAAAPTAWMSRISQNIRKAEYEFSRHEDGGWTAPNRAHDIRSRLGPEGLELCSRTGGAQTWSLAMRFTGIGRSGSPLLGVDSADPVVQGNRLEIARPSIGVTEWYINDARGLEQGFTIERRPASAWNNRAVVLELALNHELRPSICDDGRRVVFAHPQGRPTLSSGGLTVFDADGDELPSRFALADGALQIQFEDGGARYPIVVDPLFTTFSWSDEGQHASDEFGFAVATAGDVNGDGYSDVIVGAPKYDGGDNAEGKVYVYHGSASGPESDPSWTAECDAPVAELGHAVATAGDVNGDGYDDIIAGAPYYDPGNTLNEGWAFVWLGGLDGLGANGTAANADWHAESDATDGSLGVSVATAGDVNRDGFDDVILGAPNLESAQNQHEEGWVLVWYGAAGGLGAAGTPSNADWRAESNIIDGKFGWSVGTAGDVNGDGYNDVIVGWPFYVNLIGPIFGRACVWHGGAAGLGANGTPANADWMTEGDADRLFGKSVSSAGDVNGDGYSDVVVGAPELDDDNGNGSGRAYVYLGSAPGLGALPTATRSSGQSDDGFGESVAMAGDVNGDGRSDVIVGAHFHDDPDLSEGRAYVYHGTPGGIAAAPNWSTESDQGAAHFGISVATAGDVNGDGFGDVLVGASLFNGASNDCGAAFLYLGAPAGLAASYGWSEDGDQVNASFGASVATAGDVNGDGYSDLLVGAPRFDTGAVDGGKAFLFYGSANGPVVPAGWTTVIHQLNAHYGESVAGAGDVNGDGYSDVIVAAPLYDQDDVDEGKVWIYKGTNLGLLALSSWSASGEQDGARFGSSVASAGDVNGDGYADVIVGARFHDAGQEDEGRVSVYLGRAAITMTPNPWTAESNLDFAFFGSSVASAGDVNRDGYSDVIIGAPGYANGQASEGRAYVYHGSATGLPAAANWTREQNQAFENVGCSVASAGDVNGDGYSDVLVGAEHFDGSHDEEGRVRVFHGSSTGLSAFVNWFADMDQGGAQLGHSVASAGDVNADGFSDVIIGADMWDGVNSDQGGAWLHLGSTGGLVSPAAWSSTTSQTSAVLGRCVASAGDVNGDGFADVVVGAPLWDNGHQEEGRVFLFYGNAGIGLPRIPRQARYEGTAPIDLLGQSDSPMGFRLRTLGRSPAGRQRVWLEWEAEPLGTPFDGASLGSSVSHLDTGAPAAGGSMVGLDERVEGLALGNVYHWRMRVRSESPFFPRGPWLSLPYNAGTETDLRMPAAPVDVADSGTETTGLSLARAWPNPFVIQTTIAYALPNAGRVRLDVFDPNGRRVARLVDGIQPAGTHSAYWDGRAEGGSKTAPGAYFVRLEFAGKARSLRLMRVR